MSVFLPAAAPFKPEYLERHEHLVCRFQAVTKQLEQLPLFNAIKIPLSVRFSILDLMKIVDEERGVWQSIDKKYYGRSWKTREDLAFMECIDVTIGLAIDTLEMISKKHAKFPCETSWKGEGE